MEQVVVYIFKYFIVNTENMKKGAKEFCTLALIFIPLSFFSSSASLSCPSSAPFCSWRPRQPFGHSQEAALPVEMNWLKEWSEMGQQ